MQSISGINGAIWWHWWISPHCFNMFDLERVAKFIENWWRYLSSSAKFDQIYNNICSEFPQNQSCSWVWASVQQTVLRPLAFGHNFQCFYHHKCFHYILMSFMSDDKQVGGKIFCQLSILSNGVLATCCFVSWCYANFINGVLSIFFFIDKNDLATAIWYPKCYEKDGYLIKK